LFGVVEVPEDAQRLVLLLGVVGRSTVNDTIPFDGVELYKVP
jgi:hypothetical protein